MDVAARFAELMARPAASIPLDEACLLVAARAQPGLRLTEELGHLDTMADDVRDPGLEGVCRHLFGVLGFQGNSEAYYDPRNSFLNVVRERRVGIPITLSVLTAEVARRAGVELVGIGMPGHFLLRSARDPDLFLDPFHRGRVLDRRGCAELFSELHGRSQVLQPGYLEPVGPVAILTRLLGNLRAIYASAGDHPNLWWVLDLLTRLPEPPPAAWRDIGSLASGLGRFSVAAAAYEAAGVAAERAGEDPATDRRNALALRARMN